MASPERRIKAMVAQMEFVNKSFEQVFDGFRKATEATVQMQQEMFRQWTAYWPGFPKPQPRSEQCQKFQKEWAQALTELTQKYQEAWERQYKASMDSLEKAFQLAEAKDAEEFRQKMTELWQKSFDCLKDVSQTQLRNFQAAVEKWLELAKKAGT
jgi:hypothetical protein